VPKALPGHRPPCCGCSPLRKPTATSRESTGDTAGAGTRARAASTFSSSPGSRVRPSRASRGGTELGAGTMIIWAFGDGDLPPKHVFARSGAKRRNRNGTFGYGGWEHRVCRRLERKLCGQQSQTGKESKRQGNDSGSAHVMARFALIPPRCSLSRVSLPQTPRPAQTCPNSASAVETLPIRRAGLRKMQLES